MKRWNWPVREWMIALLLLQFGCAAQQAYHRAEDAAKRGEWDRAVGQYMIALNEKPDKPEYRTGFERARLAASQFHFQKAKLLMQTKNFEQAIIEFQIALNFDPTNQFVANEMEVARGLYEKEQNKEKLTEIEKAKEEAKRKMQLYKVLGPEAETTIPSMKFHDDSLKHILAALGQVAGINIVYDSDFRDQEFSVSLDNIKFKDAMDQILVANRLYYKPLDQSTILIIPDNPQKRRQYDEQVIQTFFLSNAELNDVLNMVRSVMQIQRIATNPQLNAITVRDTPDKIAIVAKIIEANDKPQSEVLLDIEILELDRDRLQRYGVDLDRYQVSQTLQIGSQPAGTFFGNQLKAIDAASWSFSIPSITYRALASDLRTRLLAKPQIRASEGKQVTVRLGDRVPIPVNVIQTSIAPAPGQPVTTYPTTTYQQQDVGINIDVTPRVHHNREISLTLRFELTSITQEGTGTTPPTIGNRTVNTVIRLKDGETNLLAGLLRTDDRKALTGVPGIVNIPLIRDLFASNSKTIQEKDIVFTITPHILRTPSISEEDLSPIWIGTEDDIQLKSAPPISVFENPETRKEDKNVSPWQLPIPDMAPEPFEDATEAGSEPEPTAPPVVPESEEQMEPQKQPAPKLEAPENPPDEDMEAEEVEEEDEEPVQDEQPPNQAQAVVPARPSAASPVPPKGGQPEIAGAAISFSSPNVNPKPDTDVILHIQLSNAASVANASLVLNFDASAMQVKDVLQGALMTPGAFSKSFDNNRGSVTINANRAPAGTESGVMATVVFHTLKAGKTSISVNSSTIRDAGGNILSAGFEPYTMTVE